jgi:uncharacterized membrane protein YedE/YeeE
VKAIVTAALCGLVFALGLGLAGMTDPSKVVGFLDISGKWDPSLAFVMGGALGTHALMRRFILRRSSPVLATAFPNTSNNLINGRLLFGAALFGVGWGLSGYCPGPVVTSVAGGSAPVLMFVGAMLVGMLGFQIWESRRSVVPSVAPVSNS